MAQDDVIELSLVVTVANVNTAVVLHLEQNTAVPGGDPTNDVIDAFLASDIPALWQARTSDQASITCIKSQVIAPVRGVATTRGANVAGSLTGETLPPQLGAQHTWQGDGWGREQKGWHTWAGVPVESHHRNRLINSAWTDEEAFAVRFNDPITQIGDYQFGVWSQKLGTIGILGFAQAQIVLKTIRTRRLQPCI